MKRISAGSVGIQQGSWMFSDFADHGVLWTGQGPRESQQRVSFKQAYSDEPTVAVWISMWDIDHKHNFRADISVQHVTAQEFHLVLRTWGDSRLARIRANWLAIGPAGGEDDWEL